MPHCSAKESSVNSILSLLPDIPSKHFLITAPSAFRIIPLADLNVIVKDLIQEGEIYESRPGHLCAMT